MNAIYRRFVDQIKEGINEERLKLSAGVIWRTADDLFMIDGAQAGAEDDLFSIGQPVFDKDGNLMGYLGIGILRNLNYASDFEMNIPVEHWEVCRPTEHCKPGKKVFTYWHIKEKEKNDGRTEE